jgi:hypothetical protein
MRRGSTTKTSIIFTAARSSTGKAGSSVTRPPVKRATPRRLSPDVAAEVRILPREGPDQRGYLIEEWRWKGWRVMCSERRGGGVVYVPRVFPGEPRRRRKQALFIR